MTKEHEVQVARIAWTNLLKNKIFKRASLAKYPNTALKLFRDFFLMRYSPMRLFIGKSQTQFEREKTKTPLKLYENLPKYQIRLLDENGPSN